MTIFTSGHRFYSTGWHKKKQQNPLKLEYRLPFCPYQHNFLAQYRQIPCLNPQKSTNLKNCWLERSSNLDDDFLKTAKCWVRHQWQQSPKVCFFLHFWENCDIRWCKNTQQIDPYPRKVIKVAWIDGVGFKRLFGDFLVEQMPRF